MNQSSISQEQVIENLSNKSNWVRLVYMLIYGVALHVAGIIMWLLCTVQFVITMIFGQDNENLRNMAATITTYIHQALNFVSYNSEDKPFPFARDKATSAETETETETTPESSTAAEDLAPSHNATEAKDEQVTIEVEAQAVEDDAQAKSDDPKSDK